MPILATKAAGSAQGFGFSGGPPSSVFICATGGTVTTSGNYKIHTFTGPGSFVVNKKPQVANATVDYLVVGGGGGASAWGGAGAGGFREGKASPAPSYSASPLAAPTGIPVTIGSYPITVGAGGSAGSNQGNPSIFSTITSAGGAKGPLESDANGFTGGSGSGASQTGTGGSGNTPPVSPPQGNSGAPNGSPASGGGGGGATASGSGRAGGAGATTSISASPTAYGGGGGASDRTGGNGPGGTGGGGNGGPSPGGVGNPGTANRGGGAGAGSDAPGGSGGSGIVIIRYQFQ